MSAHSNISTNVHFYECPPRRFTRMGTRKKKRFLRLTPAAVPVNHDGLDDVSVGYSSMPTVINLKKAKN